MNENFFNFDELYSKYYSQTDVDWINGACYIRVSTDRQTEYSPTSQLKLILEYALSNKIYIAKEHIFHDDGISGTQVTKREDFRNMINTAMKTPKPFEQILLYSFSRFARNKEEAVYYKSRLRKKGIDVISITQPLPNSKERVIIESFHEGYDEYYSLNLADDSRRGKREKAERGEHNGNPPFGYFYDRNLRKLIIVPEKAKVVKLIYEMFITTQNLRHIALTLNKLDIRPMRGKEWGTKTIKLILKNRSYIGEVKHLDKYYKGIHEPIIDKDIFDKVQKIWEYRDEHFKKCKIQVQHNHWLRGILKCKDCGKGMIYFQRKTRPDPIFQCGGYSNGKCTSHQIKVHLIEETILGQLKRDFTDKININISNKTNYIDDEINVVLSSLKKIDSKFERIKAAYQNGIDSLEEYKNNKEKLLSEKNRLENKLKELEYENKLDSRKNKVYVKCEKAYKILIDTKIDKQIKFDIAHELFDEILYDKSNDTLLITYK